MLSVGYMSQALRESGFDRVDGIDINKDAIEVAKKRNTNGDFKVKDACNPGIKKNEYDYILIREAHPFSRVNLFEEQLRALNIYIDALKEGGVIEIAHAREGGGMNYPSLCYTSLDKALKEKKNLETFGPVYLSLIKYIPTRLTSRKCWIASLTTRLFSSYRMIEAYFIKKL